MKRKLTQVLALLLGLLMLAGCSAPASSAPAPAAASGQAQDAPASAADAEKEPVTIVMMHDEAEEDRINGIQEIMDSFMEEYPYITITQMPVSDDSFDTKLKTFVAGGELPAIVAHGTGIMQMLDAEEAINTQANMEVIDRVGRDRFYAPVLDLMNSQDGEGAIAVPVTCWVAGIWYRKDLFAEKGLEPPTTWENIRAAAEAFYDPANKQYGIMMGTGENAVSQQQFQMIALSNGAELFDAEGQPQFNSPEMKEAMQFYKDLYQYTLPGSNVASDIRDAMVAGNTPMILFSTYCMNALYQAGLAENIGYVVPENTQKAAFGSPSAYTISADITPEETEAAQLYIEYVLREENNIKLLHLAPGGPNPVIMSYAEDPDYTNTDLLKAYGETTTDISQGFDNLKVFGTQDGVTNPHMGTITSTMIISKAVNEVLVQGVDIDTAMDKAQQEMLEIVNG